MIEPLQSGDALLADIESAGGDDLHLWWLGQSGFLVQRQGRHLLFDPYLSDSLTRKYHGTDKPHLRMVGRAIDPERLRFIDVVTSSHNHTDHLDGETLNALRRVNPTMRMVIPEANRAFVASRLGCEPVWPLGLDDGQSLDVAGFAFRAIASAHEKLDRDALGRHVYLGYVVQIGPWRLYHPGDCVPYPGLADRLRDQRIHLAFLPINGRDPKRGVPGNFDGREAAELARDAGIELTIPCHFELFEFNSVSPDLFVRSCEELGVRYRLLRTGERLDLSRM
jgi:L-ascorbate metabolism protein UlaG (beta-lactamase superfamily)